MKRDVPWTIAVVAFTVAVVASVHGAVAGAYSRAKETSDVYTLPPADELVRSSLGYRSALADVLWAHVLVSQGLHSQERRRFDNLTQLIDGINALDPEFREPYLFSEALITFQAAETPHAEALKVREILERGVRNRPDDGELWLALGEFVAYIAPASSFLKDEGEIEAWRLEGSKLLAHAAELGGENARISWQALGGANILSRSGDRDAAIRLYRRTLAVTDDEELKENIRQKLRRLLSEAQADEDNRRASAFSRLWQHDLPFAPQTEVLVVGPPPNPSFCAGGAHSDDLRCATTWRDWFDRL